MRTDDQLKSKRISVLEQFETNTSYFSLYLTKFLHRQIFKSFSNVIFLLLTHFFFSSVFHLTYLSTFSYYHYIARWKSSNLLYQRFRKMPPEIWSVDWLLKFNLRNYYVLTLGKFLNIPNVRGN